MNIVKNKAKKNSNKFAFVLYFFDLFWLILLSYLGQGPEFNYEFIDESVIIKAIAIFICLVSISFLLNEINFKIPRKNVGLCFVKFLVRLSTILNISTVVFFSAETRYTTGELTGLLGAYYFFGVVSNYVAFTVLLKNMHAREEIKSLMFLHGLSLIFRIDGLAEAMNAMFMIYIYMSLSVKKINLNKIVALGILFVCAIVIGLKFKLNEAFTLEYISNYMPMWIIERFGIHSFQWAKSLSGISVINSADEYFSVAWTSFLLRFDIICGCGVSDINQFKSISEAMFYDLYGLTNSGSSPGVMTSITTLGMWGVVVVVFNSLIIRVILDGLNYELNFLQIFAISFAYRIIFVDFSEYLAIISVIPFTLFGILYTSTFDYKVNSKSCKA